MKRVSEKIIIFVIFCFFSGKSFSQLSFSIDSLNISKVIWLCQNTVVIEDFAYGPRFDMQFSIRNCGQDTIRLHSKYIQIHLKYKHKWQKEIFTELQTLDSILLLAPDSTLFFEGYINLVLTGKIMTGNNYRLVNFLPQIERIVKHSEIVLEVPGFNRISSVFKNCFTKKLFFIDGTDEESIYDIDY